MNTRDLMSMVNSVQPSAVKIAADMLPDIRELHRKGFSYTGREALGNLAPGCQSNLDAIQQNQSLLDLITQAKNEAQQQGNQAAVEIFEALIALQEQYLRGLQDCHGRTC